VPDSSKKTPPQLRESHSHKARSLDVCTRTLDRWVAAGILPEPERINGRKYWPLNVEPRRDD
jgi:hypothetical protein